MLFKNTSFADTDQARAAVTFALSGLDSDIDVAVWLKNCFNQTYRGYSYDGVPAMSAFRNARGCRYLITLGLNPDTGYPHRARNMARAPEIEVRDWQEMLVAVAAHEAKHVRNFKLRKSHSEVECEIYALRMLVRWRLLHPVAALAVNS